MGLTWLRPRLIKYSSHLLSSTSKSNRSPLQLWTVKRSKSRKRLMINSIFRLSCVFVMEIQTKALRCIYQSWMRLSSSAKVWSGSIIETYLTWNNRASLIQQLVLLCRICRWRDQVDNTDKLAKREAIDWTRRLKLWVGKEIKILPWWQIGCRIERVGSRSSKTTMFLVEPSLSNLK